MTLGDPDVAYFQWQNKVSDLEEFGRPFQKEILVTDPDQVKCIVKTNIDIQLKSSQPCFICRNRASQKS